MLIRPGILPEEAAAVVSAEVGGWGEAEVATYAAAEAKPLAQTSCIGSLVSFINISG